MKSRLMGALCACIFVFVSTSTNAALVSRLGGLGVYDTDLDITWLADANAGAGSAFDDGFSSTDGRLTWASTNAWAASLTVGGFTDWRLPTTLDPDASCTDDTAGSTPSIDPMGWNCNGSEMGHLFYNELGGTAGISILTSSDPDLVLFTNGWSDGAYWSGTEYAPDPANVWAFGFNSEVFGGGAQGTDSKTTQDFAWAVRSGDVGAVPIPSAVWLFASGLLGLVGIAKKRKATQL